MMRVLFGVVVIAAAAVVCYGIGVLIYKIGQDKGYWL